MKLMSFQEYTGAKIDAIAHPSGFSVAYVCGLARGEGLTLDEMMAITTLLDEGHYPKDIIESYYAAAMEDSYEANASR